MSLRKALTRFGGAMLATMILATAGTAGAAAAPPYTLEERATAIAQPGLVYVETITSGVLRDEKTKVPLWDKPVVIYRRCSGFVVNGDGTVVSTRWCVQPPAEIIRRTALLSLARTLVSANRLQEAAVDQFVTEHERNTAYTGESPTGEPRSQLMVQLRVGTPGLSQPPAIAAKIRTVQPPNGGDIAVLQMAQGNVPAVELAIGADPRQGESVVLIGFASASGAYTPKSAKVNVVGIRNDTGTTFHRVDNSIGSYAVGGIAVDSNGRVVGVIDVDPGLSGSARDNLAFVDLTHVTAALAEAGATPALSAADRTFRAGLDAYFSGHYGDAIKKFDATLDATPSNYVAGTYRQSATDRLNIEGEPTGIATWLIIGIAALGVMILALLIVLVVTMLRRRNRRDTDTELLVPLSLNPFAPISGIPTSTGGYPGDGGWPAQTSGGPQPGIPIPHPAPQGMPVPLPPVPSKPATDPSSVPPAPPSVAEHPVAPPPAQPEPELTHNGTASASVEPPTFVWPADDDDARDGAEPENPWSPRSS